MLFAEFGTGQVLWSIMWLFLFIIWFWLLVSIFGDIFRSKDLSGPMKAFWCLMVIAFTYLGIFLYLIVRGGGMAQRAIDAAKEQQAQFAAVTGQAVVPATATDEIARAKTLLDSGAITAEEYEQLKAKALG